MSDALLHDRLDLIPDIDIAFDGDGRQASGVDVPIVVINLPHRVDRWQRIVERMSAVGLDNLAKAAAVDGRKLSEAHLRALLRSPEDFSDTPESHLTLTRPAIGCSLSHLAIWRWMLRRGLRRVIVMEDDAKPSPEHSPEALRRLVTTLPDGADHVFLGRIIMHGLADRPAGDALSRLYYFNGTFAYLVTAQACERLLAHLLPLHAHIDHQTSEYLVAHRHQHPAWYCAPAMFEPDWTQRSDCYVPLADDVPADRELGARLEAARRLLLGEGRPLLPTTV